jgi:TolB-like protein
VRLISDMVERRVFRFVIAYGAGGWAVLEVVDQLVNNDVVPLLVYRAVLALFLCGLPGALILSWYHGAKGRQEVSPLERVLLAIVAVFALGTTGLVVRNGLAASSPATDVPPTEDPRRVAVLYFEPRGGGDAEFLAAGLTEALIDNLATVQALHVVSRNGSQQFRGVSASPDSIGRTLQAGTLVGGTVAQAGDRVRVDIEVTSAANGNQYASTRLERPRAEIFTLQDELADTVAVFLRRAIGTELGERTLRAGTRSLAAWEFVQQAEQAAVGATLLTSSGDVAGAERSLNRADSLFALAANSDPAWVEPFLRRGWLAYRRSRLGGMDRTQYMNWITTGRGHADQALRLKPDDGRAIELRATLDYWQYILNLAGSPDEADRLFHSAEDGFRAAISASPLTAASAQNSLSHLLLNKGETAEAKLNALQAYVADPFLENANLTIWRIFTASWSLQDGVEARRYCDEGVRRFPDDFRFKQCRLMLMALPSESVNIPLAWQLVEDFAAHSPAQVRDVNRARGLMYVSMALARSGMPDSARSVAERGRAPANQDPLRETALLESITRTWLGDNEEAARQLSVYLAANPGIMESYRTDAARGDLPWYHQGLLENDRFRSLVGLR